MIRLALPKGRNLGPALAAFRAAGLALDGVERDRRLKVRIGDDLEALLLKDWDLPLYVEHGIADLGVVGSDVLEEVDGDLLVPVRLTDGRSRMSLIGRQRRLPESGEQVRLATKYPRTARRILDSRSWGAEVLTLSGSIELAPILDLAELALDIVQTGRTLRDNRLEELEVVRQVAPCLVVNRAAYQKHRRRLNAFIDRLEQAGVVS
ncbi:MAG: ATP phosphoribosyltransferase [Acidobacteria bacterium]|nr:MAG: ATP phosphoribosyltransferase [Acidobacteriota bacterium]